MSPSADSEEAAEQREAEEDRLLEEARKERALASPPRLRKSKAGAADK